MSKLAALQGKGQVFKIGEEELELKPLTVDELELFSIDESAPIEKQMEMSKAMISRVLKKSVPDSTDEEIANISLEHLADLMNAVMKLHKLEEDTKMDAIKQRIQSVQQAGRNKA